MIALCGESAHPIPSCPVPVLIGAIVMVHWGQWGFVATGTQPMGGMEFQVVLLVTALHFAIRGNGDESR